MNTYVLLIGAAGTAITFVYLWLVIDTFSSLRVPARHDRVAAIAAADIEADRNHGWKATGAVLASTSVLVLISVTPLAWHLVPLLGLGSALAVITAFLVDRQAMPAAAAPTTSERNHLR